MDVFLANKELRSKKNGTRSVTKISIARVLHTLKKRLTNEKLINNLAKTV